MAGPIFTVPAAEMAVTHVLMMLDVSEYYMQSVS